jgi:FolB domain-containing protein
MARTVVGLAEWERDKKQDVSISLVLHLDLRPAGRSDRVEDTVDYKAIKNRILQRVESTSFALIERMAEVIAQICLDDPKVQRVDVTVDKLSALRFARSVAVEISRSRAEIEPP